MQIIEDKALHLKLRHPERVLATIPKSKQLDDGTVLVHWGLEEAQVLKNLGVKAVPSPIQRRYKWPGLFKPFDHQRETSAFLTMYRRAFCFNDPGTGKTASFAWAADFLIDKGFIKRALVICPLSIMDSAWRADLFKTVMHRRVDIAHGSREKRVKVINSDAEFVIINFDGVETVLEDLKAGGFDLVIIDEANAVKTATTKRWKAINSLLRADTWLWMATGTPASQSPTDAYGLAKMLNSSTVPTNFYSFRDSVMYKATQFKWVAKKNAAEIVNRVLQPAIRFTKDECLDLPDLLYTTREVALTPQQAKYYKMLKDQFVIAAAGETVTSVNAATNINKLLQVACIAYNTDVLTDLGWLPIQLVTSQHRVWDGVEWVAQQGAIFRGVKSLVTVAGVRMTADHKVLTNDGWATADDILKPRATGAGLDWAEVRLPDGNAGGGSLRDKKSDATCATVSVQLAARKSAHYAGTERVYDLVNCGPRSRFVVRGATGTPLIVHNCGAVYTDDGNTVEFDITHRYNVLIEAIEESTHKVLVFVPFRHAIDVLHDRLRKDGYAVDVIHGGVPVHRRTETFKAFQTESDPRVLLIQPAAASHGVTLHAANTVVWWGPVTSNEIYHQANARVHRAGQKNPCLVVRLCGCNVERKLYEALDAKTESMDTLLDLYKEALDS